MRDLTHRCLSVLLVCAVVGAGAFAYVNLDQGPDAVDQYGGVEDAQAAACGGACVVAVGVVGAAAGAYAYKKLFAEPALENIQAAEAVETHKNVYAAAATQRQNQDILNDSMSNYLQDTRSIARMEGKNAIIRAYNNESSRPKAAQEARTAVDEYYSTKQHQLWSLYQTTHARYVSLYKDVQSTEGLSTGDVFEKTAYQDAKVGVNDNQTIHNVSLLNGETRQVTPIKYDGGNNPRYDNPFRSGDSRDVPVRIEVLYPQDQGVSMDPVMLLDVREYYDLWAAIEQQAATVKQEMTNFTEQTYSKYQTGEINNSDLIDPYLGAREYGPESQYGTWGIRSMTSMGYSAPVDLGNTKWMTVSVGNDTYDGILLSESTPSGGFEIGTTYNASDLAGPQLIQTDSGSVELTGAFTIESITRPDGTKRTTGTVEYRDPTYRTTSIEGYKERLDRLQNLTAQLNARQNRLTNTSGGGSGGLLSGGLPFDGYGVGAAIVAFLALMALGVVRG